QAQIQVLNSDYNATDIQFTLVKTTTIKSKDCFENVFPGSPQEQAMKLLYNVRHASTLNIFNLIFNSTAAASRAHAIPSAYYRSPKSDRMIIRHSTTPGAATAWQHPDIGSTSVQEIGHWTRVMDSFRWGGCDDGVRDNIAFADTPPQASGSDGCPRGRDSCVGD
ncbi:hypothetical protein CPC08DRAFT_649552, partial [Agrocybe pediades]